MHPLPRTLALVAGVTAAAAATLAAAAAGPAETALSGPAATVPAATVPATTVTVHPDAIRLAAAATSAPSTTVQCEKADGIACYQPGQLRTAYHLPALYARGVTGAGTTIMIVDPFGSPTIKSDLATFDQAFGYPAPPKLTVITPAGKLPKFDPDNSDLTGWAQETTLDVEYAHALAPGASILLAETPVSETEGTAGFPQIVEAERYGLARYPVDVISQSFGATEPTFKDYAQLAPLRAAYKEARGKHVTVVTASGDAGATDYTSSESGYYARPVTSWPDSDPLVTAVGGTQLKAGSGGYTAAAWNDTYDKAWNLYASGSAGPVPAASGGGLSQFFARPSYQDGVKAVTGDRRGVPDISMSAACDGAVSIYSSYQPGVAGWSLTCGTSEATPEFAAVVALADQVAGRPLGLISPALYRLAAAGAPGITDVTAGSNTVSFAAGNGKLVKVTGYAAKKGYDLVTGVGTVNASALVYELAGQPAP
jgi:subtilase family serine protease